MKIDKIQNNLVGVKNNPDLNHGVVNTNLLSKNSPMDSTSFTGSGKAAVSLMDAIKSKFFELFPKRERSWINFINRFKSLEGEKGGIVITAIGTGFVAPIPIAFNPFVKAKSDATEEEKNEVNRTKAYTAMRQPISAALAILLQTPILKYIDRTLDNWTNNPDYSKNLWVLLDRSALNSDSYKKDQYKDCYLGRQIAKELESKSIDELLAEASLEPIKGESKADTIKRLIKYRSNAQVETVAENLKNLGKIKIGERFIDNSDLAKVINEQIENYAKEIAQLKKDEAHGIPFYLNRAKILIDNEAELRSVLDPAKLPADPEALKTYLTNTSEKVSNKDVKMILGEIIDKCDAVRGSRCSRTLERIDRIKRACNQDFSLDKYYEYMKSTNRDLDEVIDAFRELKFKPVDIAGGVDENAIKRTLAALTQKCNLSEVNPRISGLLRDIGIFEADPKAIGNRVYEDVVRNFKKYVADNFKGTNQITKILVGVCITLPITCTALNWVYPRFMEIFFPGLAGTKKSEVSPVEKNGGDK